jgi:beta-RFAP synthase
MSLRVRVRTPSRLHFGLLGWGPQLRRQFGGIGLMIDSPGIELVAEAARCWTVEGPLATRVERIVGQLRSRLQEAGASLCPARIRIESSPEEHVGLGVGTQLSLAVARALLELAGFPQPTVDQLARLTGRGSRSGIGLHGFRLGGLIVDGGRANEAGTPALLARVPFPADWSVVIVQPPGQRGLHGSLENSAFAELPPIAPGVTDALCRLVLLDILPAVIEHDLQAFGDALGELQVRVGACFAAAQGGIYATARSAAIVAELKRLGFTGAGQSSWGPTLYAFAQDSERNLSALFEGLGDYIGLRGSNILRAMADNDGARIIVCD